MGARYASAGPPFGTWIVPPANPTTQRISPAPGTKIRVLTNMPTAHRSIPANADQNADEALSGQGRTVT